MYQLHDTQLPDDALDRATVRACFRFSALFVDFLQDLGSLEVIDGGAAKGVECAAALVLLEQDSGTVLANVLQRGLDVSQVSDMEHGERESNVAKVTRAVGQGEEARRAGASFARGALQSISYTQQGMSIY